MKLQKVHLGNNSLEGSFPEAFCTLELRVLQLHKNRFHGRLPPCLSWMTKLTQFVDPYFFGPLLLWGCENIVCCHGSWIDVIVHFVEVLWGIRTPKLSPTAGNLAVFQAQVVPEQQQVRRSHSRLERYVAFGSPVVALQSFSRLSPEN